MIQNQNTVKEIWNLQKVSRSRNYSSVHATRACGLLNPLYEIQEKQKRAKDHTII